MSYNNDNQAIVKKVVSDNPNAPKLRLELTVNGQRYKAGLWGWSKKDGTPVLDKNGNHQWKGDVEVDDWVPEGQPQPAANTAPELADFDDEQIPF